RAEPGRCRAGGEVPVRAPRVFCRRPRFQTGKAGIQPGGVAEGFVGEGSAEGAAAGEEVMSRVSRVVLPVVVLVTVGACAVMWPRRKGGGQVAVHATSAPAAT